MVNEKEVQKEKRTVKQKVLFGLKITGNVLFYSLLLLVLLFSISNIRAKSNKGIPNLFGKGYLVVLSPSMDGDNEDSFAPGDLIIIDMAKEKNISKLEVGDIVTFWDATLETKDGKGALNTHRIIYIDDSKSTTKYYTAGDVAIKLGHYFDKEFDDKSIAEAQENSNGEIQWFTAGEIKGIYSGKIKGMGYTVAFIVENFVVCIILPVGAFFILEVALFIFHLIKMREEKLKLQLQAESSNSEPTETEEEMKARLKEELRKQLLAEMAAEAEKQNKQESDSDSEE